MKKTLYLKFILAYLIFGFFGAIVLSVSQKISKEMSASAIQNLSDRQYLRVGSLQQPNFFRYRKKPDRRSCRLYEQHDMDHQSIRAYGAGFLQPSGYRKGNRHRKF